MVHASWRAAVVGLLAAALGACASSPPTRFLTLDPVAATTPPGAAIYGGPAVRVRRVHVPDALDRAEVASEPQAGEISVDAFAHWAAPLGALARAALTEDLAAVVGPRSLVTPEAPLPPNGCDLVVDVLSFNVAQGVARMQASWTLLGSGGRARAGARVLALKADTAGRGAAAVAGGLSSLLGALSADIAQNLAASGPGACLAADPGPADGATTAVLGGEPTARREDHPRVERPKGL